MPTSSKRWLAGAAPKLFATPAFSADQLFVNVQPLSGAPANNAVYTRPAQPGRHHPGHEPAARRASHPWLFGQPFGKALSTSCITTSIPTTEQIDYDAVEALAKENKPKIIIAGYSSYPWAPDWARFRAIADMCGAVLMADISHIAGLVVAGVIPSPVGFAQVITFTTHKTLCGPRGACILTTDAAWRASSTGPSSPANRAGRTCTSSPPWPPPSSWPAREQFRQLQQQIVPRTV